MFNWLMEIKDSGVVSDIISPDNITDGYGTKTVIENNQFFIGFLAGILTAIGVYFFIKLCIYIFKKAYYDKNEEE